MGSPNHLPPGTGRRPDPADRPSRSSGGRTRQRARSDRGTPDQGKADAGKADAGKAGAGKAGAGKAGAGKADAGKADAGKADAGKAPPDLLNVNEVAAALRVSKMTVYRFVRDGRMPAVRIGNSLRVYRSDLDRYLASAFLPQSGADSGPQPGRDLSGPSGL